MKSSKLKEAGLFSRNVGMLFFEIEMQLRECLILKVKNTKWLFSSSDRAAFDLRAAQLKVEEYAAISTRRKIFVVELEKVARK